MASSIEETKFASIIDTVYDSLDKLKFFLMCSLKELEIKLSKDYNSKFDLIHQKLALIRMEPE